MNSGGPGSPSSSSSDGGTNPPSSSGPGTPGDVFLSRSYLVTKHSWKGKYRRVFSLGPRGAATLNPASMEATNHWSFSDVMAMQPSPSSQTEFLLVYRKGRSNKTDSMRFSSDLRALILTDALKHHDKFGERIPTTPKNFFAYKYHWSENRVSVQLSIGPHALIQIDPASHKVLAHYFYKDVAQLYEVSDYPGGFVVQDRLFGRLHLFASESRSEILQAIAEHATTFVGINLEKPRSYRFDSFTENKFGKFRADLCITSISEFTVYKQSPRHPDPVRRRLCLTETCLVERDPATYAIVSLRPLASVAALVRHLDHTQLFSLQFVANGEVRSYTSTERDALLASLLDGVRGAGNRDVHVRSTWLELGRRLGPLNCPAEEEVEAAHLKFLTNPPPGWSFTEAVSRFNANVSYSGLAHAVTQEHLFAQNKEKLIHSALLAILNRDVSEVERLRPENLEQQFHALRRLVASKAGFSAFTALPGFREKIGARVARSLRLGHDGISHAAIDMVCALMEPMHDNFDLRQEQLNKSSLLSSDKFLEGLLDMWTVHVTRGTGALIVAAMLDFLTFALCAPYSETTDGKQFDVLLEKVADRGRTLYRLFQQPSHTIVKGAGLLMKAIIEEGSEEVGRKMQLLALAEGALPIHLRTALFTKSSDNQLLMARQLSRHLVGLWTTDNQSSQNLLKRIFPAGLLTYLHSSDDTPSREADRLHVRDNLKMAVTDADSNKGNTFLRVAGKSLKQGKEIAAKTAEVVGERTAKYTEEAWKVSEKYVELAMQHWRQKMGGAGEWRSSNSVQQQQQQQGLAATVKPQDRPIVLRKRRQRVRNKLNWPLFYFMFEKDHEKPNLLWNLKTRQELHDCLESEIRSFLQDRELGGGSLISWNYAEFSVAYTSLADEIRIGDYFLRVLLQEDASLSGCENADDDPILKLGNASEFFNDLYHRFLLTPKVEMKCLCLQAMAVVYGRNYADIGPFNDTKYIVAMLERTFERSERDRLLLFLNKLVLHRDNAAAFTAANGVRVLVDLLPLAHLHSKRAVASGQTTAIETSADAGEAAEAREKEWYAGSADSTPVSFSELCRQYSDGGVNAKTKVWAQGMEGWRSLQQVAQLKWTLCARGNAVMNESELAALILDLLASVCRFYPSKDDDGAIIRPLPRVKQSLSDASTLPHLVQLLLTFEPYLVEKVATLLYLVLEDNPRLPTLYLTGFFFFVLMYTGSNVLPIGRFLAMAHEKQAFRSEDKVKGRKATSILAQMLPDAMVAYLTNHGPDKFAEIFLGEFDTPEAIWNNEMRLFTIQKIAHHLADYSPRLRSNVRALYQYCPIPAVEHPKLSAELFCDIYYLRNLCDTAKFPEWPIQDPLNLLREVLTAWRAEVEKKPSSMTARDALAVLGLGGSDDEVSALLMNHGTSSEGESAAAEAASRVRKAYFRMAQKYHPDKNPAGRDMFEKVNAAYEFLCAKRGAKDSGAPDPDNIVLILRAQSILFGRCSHVLRPYKYAGYPMLIKTIRMETADEKLFSKSAPLLAAASECAYHTVRCSALNAEELRRENGLEVLYQAFERCASVLSASSKPDDIAVQVCTHVIRFYSVASRFEQCRERMVEMPELVKNICRVFYYKQLPGLCSVACECVSSLSVDHILQMHFLQSGALWHLLLFFFDYDVTLAEGGVATDEATSPKAVANRLACLAVRACARMAGLLSEESGSFDHEDDGEAETAQEASLALAFPAQLQVAPKNPVIEESLEAMLSQYVVSRMRDNEIKEVLKLLNTDSENPYLVWDMSTRAELTEFLENERTSSVRTGTCDPAFGSNFKFTAHENELVVGGIFVRIFNQQSMFQLREPKRFAVDLLEYLNGQAQYLYSLLSMAQAPRPVSGTAVEADKKSNKLVESEMALEALANVIKYNKGIEIQCIGHFKLLFCLLRLESFHRLQEMALMVLSQVTGSTECVEDIAASNVLGHLLQVCYSLPENQGLALTVLHSLMGDTRIVKEGLGNGVVVTLVHAFCCSKDPETRVRAAEVLSKMSSDKLMGPKAGIALSKFLPEIFLDAVKKSAETAVQMYETDHENPELIWNDAARRNLVRVVTALANSHYQHLRSSPDLPWQLPTEAATALSPAASAANELVISGIYVRLFVANPGWVLRKPREFLTDLLEEAIRLMENKQQDIDASQRLETVTTALTKLLATQPSLAEVVPATGYLSRLFVVMQSLGDHGVRAALLIVAELSRSSVCVENMSSCPTCVSSLKRAHLLRKDLVNISCDALSRIFAGHHDTLIKQALDCQLVEELLSVLDSPAADMESRALVSRALKAMAASLAYGERVSSILRSNPVWAQFESQRHDLFIKNDGGVAGAIAAAPGVAGYLTSTSAAAAKQAPTAPPPMDTSGGHGGTSGNPLL